MFGNKKLYKAPKKTGSIVKIYEEHYVSKIIEYESSEKIVATLKKKSYDINRIYDDMERQIGFASRMYSTWKKEYDQRKADEENSTMKASMMDELKSKIAITEEEIDEESSSYSE